VIPVEAKMFLEEDTTTEALNNAPIASEQDGEEEDLVCEMFFNILFFEIIFLLLQFDLI